MKRTAKLADGSRLYTHYVDDWGLERDTAKHVEIDDMKGRQVARVVVVSPKHSEDEFVSLEIGRAHV